MPNRDVKVGVERDSNFIVGGACVIVHDGENAAPRGENHFFKHACQRSNVICTDTYPPEEIPLPPRALSQVFRATESLLDCTFREEHLRSVTLEAAIGAAQLSITVGHEHLGPESVDVLQCFRHELKSTAHRLNTLRGQLSFDRHGTGLNFYVEIPLAALA